MQIIIDGYNLINFLIKKGLIFEKSFYTQAAREQTLSLIEKYQAWKRRTAVTVVFDGQGDGRSEDSFNDLRIIYSGEVEKADGVIEELVDFEIYRDKKLSSLEIVTDDRQIREYLREKLGLDLREHSDLLVKTSDFAKRLTKVEAVGAGEELDQGAMEQITDFYKNSLSKKR